MNTGICTGAVATLMLVSLHGQVQGLRGGDLDTAPVHGSTLRGVEHISTQAAAASKDMSSTVPLTDHDFSTFSSRKLSQLTAPCSSRSRYDIHSHKRTVDVLPNARPIVYVLVHALFMICLINCTCAAGVGTCLRATRAARAMRAMRATKAMKATKATKAMRAPNRLWCHFAPIAR